MPVFRGKAPVGSAASKNLVHEALGGSWCLHTGAVGAFKKHGPRLHPRGQAELLVQRARASWKANTLPSESRGSAELPTAAA